MAFALAALAASCATPCGHLRKERAVHTAEPALDPKAK